MILLRALVASAIGFTFSLALAEATIGDADEIDVNSPSQVFKAEETDRSSLQNFVREILNTSFAVREKAARVEAARSRMTGSKKPLHNPLLGFESEKTDINTNTISISQTIDLSGKRDALEQIAFTELKIAEATFQESMLEVAVEAMTGLVNYHTSYQLNLLTKRSSELMDGFLGAMNQRLAAGDVQEMDVNLAQLAYLESLMNLALAESQIAQAESELAGISSVPIDSLPSIPRNFDSVPITANTEALGLTPKLVRLQSETESAKAKIELASREGKIDPTVGISGGKEGSESLISLSVEIPLFVRNKFSAGIDAATQDSIAATEAYRNEYQRALAGLEGARLKFEQTRSAWEKWRTNGEKTHQRQLVLLEELWQVGELSASDYLFQLRQSIDVQIAAESLLGEAWLAALDWLKASNQLQAWLNINAKFQYSNYGDSE